MQILSFLFFSPVGRWLLAGGLSLIAVFVAYEKGRIDGRASYKLTIERQINDAIQNGQQGAADALRKLNGGGLPNSWFRD